MATFVSINGKIKIHESSSQDLEGGEAGLSPLNRGLLYGDLLMETLLVREKTLIMPHAHLQRMRAGCEVIGISFPWSLEELVFEMETLVAQNAYPWGYLRFLITATHPAHGLWSPIRSEKAPLKIMYYGPYEKGVDQGIELKFPEDQGNLKRIEGIKAQRKIAFHYGKSPRLKTNNYLNDVIALNQAAKEGYQEIIWTREDGEILEASTSNLFLLARQGDSLEIITPPLESGILPGITRSTVIELLTRAKIPVTEQKVFIDEMPRFDEAFLTSSLAGLRPLGSIDRQKLHTVRPQATFWHLNRLYSTWLKTYRSENAPLSLS